MEAVDDAKKCQQWSLEHCCYILCKRFLESYHGADGFALSDSYVSVVGQLITSMGNATGGTASGDPGNERKPVSSLKMMDERARVISSSAVLDENQNEMQDNLQSLIILSTFCIKILTKDLIDDKESKESRSLTDYIEYLFGKFLSNNDEESVQRKNYMLKSLNLQRILRLKELRMMEGAAKLFSELESENLVLYSGEVRGLICNPESQIPDHLHYGTFTMAMKQLVHGVLEKLRAPFLWTVASYTEEHTGLSLRSSNAPSRMVTAGKEAEAGDYNALQTGDFPAVVERLDQTKTKMPKYLTKPAKPKSPKHCFGFKQRKFTPNEVEWLIEGIRIHGAGKWKIILDSFPFRNRTSVNLKDKYRNMIQKGEIE